MVDELRAMPPVSPLNPQRLPSAGTVTFTVTAAVDSKIGLGLIVTVAPDTPYLASTVSTWAWASAELAPGTITKRHASYDAWSVTCRMMETLASSIEPRIKKNNTVAAIENSTAVAPWRLTIGADRFVERRENIEASLSVQLFR